MGKVAIIGGGAAGFFAALNISNENEIHIFEKSSELLSKVSISGGGRCNVTNSDFDLANLKEYYPRGNKELRQAFSVFDNTSIFKWFKDRGVHLRTESDCRVFPESDSSAEIINCFLKEANDKNVNIHNGFKVVRINKNDKFKIIFQEKNEDFYCDKIIVATGGISSSKGYNFLQQTGHKIIPPVPSLFAFDSYYSNLIDLEGISLKKVKISVLKRDNYFLKNNYSAEGGFLITHNGISGPAVLRLSSYAARELNMNDYKFVARINFILISDIDFEISFIRDISPSKIISSQSLFGLPLRLWKRICEISGIDTKLKWNDISKKKIHLLKNTLENHPLFITDKTTNKEEFVTCGGVSLKEIDFSTMESKLVPGLYFAGEVLDIDGITGGYNFQSAWTTGYIAAKAICSKR
ncbi:MAG: NAD(P)/FAD-dependent oxidoreductase [Ignavibacteria bacterium]|nr:NAD(P)/FAD-dependent oxidoreductase [Ignavibacteria bacterium]